MKFRSYQLYIGCPVQIAFEGESGKYDDIKYGKLSWHWEEDEPFYIVNHDQDYDHDDYESSDFELKLLLRPLSSMTEEENREYSVMAVHRRGNGYEMAAAGTRYLLSKHFDLFGLIETGLAIDASKVSANA